MHSDLGKPLKSLNVDGGASANNLLMQIQADLLGVPLKRPKFIETTALGAVFAAGLGAGIWKSLDDVRHAWKLERTFTPAMTKQQRSEARKAWTRAVRLACDHEAAVA